MNDIVKKDFPIGIDNFKKLIKTSYFVDKTHFIKDILDHQGVQVSLITRPRRFGKTLMISMLRHFFDIENKDLNRELFSGLKIESLGSQYMNRLGSSPVIFITLKDLNQCNFDSFILKISNLMSTIYTDFAYILDSDKLHDSEKTFFNKICYNNSNVIDLEDSLKKLSQLLYKYYKKEVIILIDEYDAPIISAWKNGYYDKCINFMRQFLGGAFKTNDYLDFAILTGITRIARESIFSGVNNFKTYSVLSDTYSDIFGFTEDEIIQIMKHFNIDGKLDELKDWYDGYIFGKFEIYNPWSILNYFSDGCIPQSYWINTSENTIINNILKTNNKDIIKNIESLIRGNCIEKYIDETLVYADIENNDDALYSLLVSSGYLKIINKKYEDNRWLCNLQIPNKEIFNCYKQQISFNLSQSNDLKLKKILSAMLTGNIDLFSEIFQNLLIEIVSYFDTNKKTQEQFYHGFILGLIVYLRDSYIIESNKESGYGRFDIACIPKYKNNPGVILEFKSSKSKNKLNSDANNALKQIKNKKYSTLLKKYDLDIVWNYGIAFYKQYVAIKSSITKLTQKNIPES